MGNSMICRGCDMNPGEPEHDCSRSVPVPKQMQGMLRSGYFNPKATQLTHQPMTCNCCSYCMTRCLQGMELPDVNTK